MTQEEINALLFHFGNRYALVNTVTKQIMIDSDNEQDCIDAKRRMGIGHPLFNVAFVVHKDDEENDE